MGAVLVSMDIRIANTWMAKEGRKNEEGRRDDGWMAAIKRFHPPSSPLRPPLSHPTRPRHPYIRVSNLRAIPPFLF